MANGVIQAGDNGVAVGAAGDDILLAAPVTYAVTLRGAAASGTGAVTIAADGYSASVDLGGLQPGGRYTVALVGDTNPATGLPIASHASAGETVLLSFAGTAGDSGLHAERNATLQSLGDAAAALLPLDLRGVVVSLDGTLVAQGTLHLAPLNTLVAQTFPSSALVGGAGNDRLIAGNGDALMTGGPGNDVLSGGRGNDVMTGGPGADLFVLSPGRDNVSDFTPAQGDRLAMPGGLSAAPVIASAHDTANGVVLNLPGGSEVTIVGHHDAGNAGTWF